MIVALVSKIAAGLTLAAVTTLTIFSIVPQLPNTTGVWLDSPLDKATIVAGSTHFVAHSDLPDLTAIRMVLTLDGADAASLTDPDLQKVARGKGAAPLFRFDQPWTATPGVYEIAFYTKTASSAFTEARRTTLTVVDADRVAVDTAEGTSTPQPTATETPEPTESPTEQPTVAATTAPTTPPVVSTPTPTPTATVAPPPTIAGSVTRVQTTGNDWSNVYYVTGSSPQSATVVVQVASRVANSGGAFNYVDVPCSSLVYDTGSGTSTRYKCQTGTYVITPSYGPGEFWPTQEIRFRVKLTSNGSTYLSPHTTYTAEMAHPK